MCRIMMIAILAVSCGCASMPTSKYFVGDWRGGGETLHKIFSFIDSQKHKLKCMKVCIYENVPYPDEPAEEEEKGHCYELVMAPDNKEGVNYDIHGILDEFLHNNQYGYFYFEDKDTSFYYEPNSMDCVGFFCKMEFGEFRVYIGMARLEGGLVIRVLGKCPIEMPVEEMCQFRNPRFLLTLLRKTALAYHYQVFRSDLTDDPEFDPIIFINLATVLYAIAYELPESSAIVVKPVNREKVIEEWEEILPGGMYTKQLLGGEKIPTGLPKKQKE